MAEPWDLLRGRDVFALHDSLISELDTCEIGHWAPNCSTFSRARERPIPGVKFPPLPLRSTSCPRGIPDVLKKLPKGKKRKLDLDTCMAEMAAKDCIRRSKAGKFFSLEHPRNSIARNLDSWKDLEALPGTIVTEYHTCMFRGSKRRKHQALIHNMPQLVPLIGRLCQQSKCCQRTGEKHLSWRPQVEGGRVVKFSTGEEREYPLGFCEAFAEGLAHLLEENKESMRFIEIFSGPNAPLSTEVAKRFGDAIPRPYLGSDERWISKEASEMKEMQGVALATLSRIPEDALPSNPPEDGRVQVQSGYRQDAVEAGKQPSFGKRNQLILDGLLDPKRHLELAKGLSHPFELEFNLKQVHRGCIDFVAGVPEEVIENRLQALARVKSLVKGCKVEQRAANARASWTAKALGCKINTVAMEVLQKEFKIEDLDVPRSCLFGLKILGPAQLSPFFEEFEVPPKMTLGEYHSTKRSRSREMIKRVASMSKAGGEAMMRAIWDKTLKEISSGSMGPPKTWDEIDQEYQGDFQVVPSFGLQQGLGDDGKPKYRRIDDHTAAGNNLIAHRRQKVPMVMVDHVGLLLKALSRKTNSPVRLATEDMKGAYRQVPLDPSDVRYCITAIMNPESNEPTLHEMRAQPFGAGHAVPNFCRVSEWLARLLQNVYHMVADHFFDDFFVVEPSTTIDTAMFVLRETFSLLGFSLDSEKSQPPSSVQAVLGVLFNTLALKNEKKIRIEPKPTRVSNLIQTIDQVLDRRSLTPSQAASLVGKFGFLCSTLFGKVGRCCTAPVRFRQYGSPHHVDIDHALENSLLLMKDFLRLAPVRELSIAEEPPLILYTDASDVPPRVPRWVVGAVLYDPRDATLKYSSWEVPREVVAHWSEKQNFMGQLELLAAPFGLSTWRDVCTNRSIILFVDNDSASANLVRGYSPKSESSTIVGEFWLLAAALRASVYIERVESKSNIADGPSRLDFSIIQKLGGIWTEPHTDRLGSPSIHPSMWFGAPLPGGKEDVTSCPKTTGGGDKSR